MHLVTGGSGFIGSVIAKRLLARGEAVRVFDLWKPEDMPVEIEFVKGDINDVDAVEAAMKGVEHVHHNVALVPLSKAGDMFHKVNVDGTKVALRAAKRANVKMFSHMSSSAVYGRPALLPISPETSRTPIEAYGRAKKEGEDLALVAAKEGLPVSIIRPRTVIGNGRLGIFQILFDWIRDGANIFVIGDGSNLFQFVHVDDLADVSILACLEEKPGQYNAGTDKFGTLRQALENLCAHATTGTKVKSLPVGPTVFCLRLLDKLALSPLGPWHYLTYHTPFYFDISEAQAKLNWKPKYSNNEMLTNAYDWFVSSYDPNDVSADASSHRRPVRQKILKLVKRVA